MGSLTPRSSIRSSSTPSALHASRFSEKETQTPLTIYVRIQTIAYDKGTYYISHRGWTPSHLANWAHMGAAAGIAFSWRGLTGHSRDSHKLLRFGLEARPSAARSTTFHRGPPGAVGLGPGARVSPAFHGGAFRPGSNPAPALDPFPRPPPQVPQPQQQPWRAPSAGTRSSSSSSAYHQRGAAPPAPTSSPFSPPPQSQPQPQPQPRGPALQFRLAHAIFRAYFEEDRDLSDRGALADIGAAATGYPAAEVRACLDDEDAGAGVGSGPREEGPSARDKGKEGAHRHVYADGDGDGEDGARERRRSRHLEGRGDGDGTGGVSAAGKVKAESEAGAGTETEDGGGGAGSWGGGRGWSRAVDALEADVRARGISAVPTIIVQDRYLAGGWQEARLFVELFERIKRGEADRPQQPAGPDLGRGAGGGR